MEGRIPRELYITYRINGSELPPIQLNRYLSTPDKYTSDDKTISLEWRENTCNEVFR